MRAAVFGARNGRELVRDPASLAFGAGLPVALLLMMQLIYRSTGGAAAVFALEAFAPGAALFSLTFLCMFAAMLLAGDRESAYLTRLYASPMTAGDFLLGYSLPLLPLGLAQGVLCFAAAACLGLRPGLRTAACLAAMLPAILLFVALGLLLGSTLRYRQVGPLASIVVQIAALSSGMWFDLELIGGAFRAVCRVLPFARALELMQGALTGRPVPWAADLLWIGGWTAALAAAAVLLFRRQMRQ